MEELIFETFNEDIRCRICNMALEQHHKPYRWMSRGPDSFDCAGFTYFVIKQVLNININEKGYGLSTTTKQMTSKHGEFFVMEENLSGVEKIKIIEEDVSCGDLMFFHRQSINDIYPSPFNKFQVMLVYI